MAITSVHPHYIKFSPLWKKMLDCFKGADHIKEQGTDYLPATASMRYDGMGTNQDGLARYNDYKKRAKFPEYVNDAVLNHGGMLHGKDAVIELPEGMEFIRTKATSKGESILALLRRINELQLRDGRLGLMLELPAGESRDTMPYIAVYEALSLRNWDDAEDELGDTNLNLVVLDESRYVFDKLSFEWKWKEQYRVLSLGSLDVEDANDTGSNYVQWLSVMQSGEEGKEELRGDPITPMYKGNVLQQIPFVFCNAMDLASEPDRPPLLTLANEAIAIYQGEADYRQSLFMQGQDTLVVKGGILNTTTVDDKAPVRVGAGARLDLNNEGDAKYIGVNSQGLPEQRKALEADHMEAKARAGSLTSSESASQESGDALRTRLASKTASLVGIAKTGAAALEALLRICAEWMQLDPNQVKVTPNLDFSKSNMVGQDFVQVMTAKNLGAPISHKSVHEWLEDKGMTGLNFEDELVQIELEKEKYKFLEPVGKADQNGAQQVQKITQTQTE